MNISNNKTGFTKVDHITFDLILPTLSPSEQSIFLRIYRQTVGWKKQSDKISISQFKKFTGILHNETIEFAIKRLENRTLIIVKKANGKTTEYEINWSYILEMYSK